MTYPILDPLLPNPTLAAKCALVIMAKAPRPGRVKTRLAPPLSLEQSAALNVCFLRDTARNVADVAGRGNASGVVCYTPVGDESLFDGLLPCGFSLIAQRGHGFGERLLAAATDVLACGFGAVCLIDSDSPTVPAAAFEQAIKALGVPGDRVVLGASSDGGYYLIGLKQSLAAVFEGITWSSSHVYAETAAAISGSGCDLVELPLWYDVDDAGTLALLADELLSGVLPPFAVGPGYPAPYTREFLHLLQAAGGLG